MITQEILNFIATQQSQRQLLYSYFRGPIYHQIFNDEIRSFFKLPETAVSYNMFYPMYYIDKRFDFAIEGNFECVQLQTILSRFSIHPKSELFKSAKKWFIEVNLNENNDENKDEDENNIFVIPVAMLPMFLNRLNNHPLHYLIQCYLFPDEIHLEKYRKKLEIYVLSHVWLTHYGTNVILTYQEHMFGSRFIVDATICHDMRKLCLEVNENGHRSYDMKSEVNRHESIKTISVNVITFDGTGSSDNSIDEEKLNEFLENVNAGIHTLIEFDMVEIQKIIDDVEQKSNEVGQILSNILGKTIFSSGFPLTDSDMFLINPSLANDSSKALRNLIRRQEYENHFLVVTQGELKDMINKIHDSMDAEYYRIKKYIWIFREEVNQFARNTEVALIFDDIFEEIYVESHGKNIQLPFLKNDEALVMIAPEPKLKSKNRKNNSIRSFIKFKYPSIGAGTTKKFMRFSRTFSYRYLASRSDEVSMMLFNSICKCYDKIPYLIMSYRTMIQKSMQNTNQTYSLGIERGIDQGKNQELQNVSKYQQKIESLEVKYNESQKNMDHHYRFNLTSEIFEISQMVLILTHLREGCSPNTEVTLGSPIRIEVRCFDFH